MSKLTVNVDRGVHHDASHYSMGETFEAPEGAVVRIGHSWEPEGIRAMLAEEAVEMGYLLPEAAEVEEVDELEDGEELTDTEG